jgi:hypothetical protein
MRDELLDQHVRASLSILGRDPLGADPQLLAQALFGDLHVWRLGDHQPMIPNAGDLPNREGFARRHRA